MSDAADGPSAVGSAARSSTIIAEELAADRRGRAEPRCACHGLQLRLLSRPRARRARRRRGAPGPARRRRRRRRRWPALIDHTLLKPDATRPTSRRCAARPPSTHFATVCVNPTWVALCAAAAARHAASASARWSGFPLGATTADVKHYETRRAIFDGATEIDMVINVGALKSGDLRLVEQDIEAVTRACRDVRRRSARSSSRRRC